MNQNQKRSGTASAVKRLWSRASSAVVVAAIVACSGEVTQPDRTTEFEIGGPSRLLGDDTPLSVVIDGPFYVSTAGTYQYTATVSGGSGAYRYRWLSRWCNIGPTGAAACATNYTLQTDSSATLSYRVVSTDVRNDLVVEVQDASLTGRSGKEQFSVDGPMEWPERIPANSPFQCNLGMDWDKFPLEYPEAGPPAVRNLYRRNPCSGAKEQY